MGIVIGQALLFRVVKIVPGNGPGSTLHVDIRIVVFHFAIKIATIAYEHVPLDNAPNRTFLHVNIFCRGGLDYVARDFRIVYAPVIAAIAVL